MKRKGILLAGGTGTRLHPLTRAVNKHLLPVYDKPMLYYPLSVLMLTGIRDILIIGQTKDLPLFQALLGDGSDFGITLSYAVQDEPRGIPEAFLIAKDFIGTSPVAMILGDNIFFGEGLARRLAECSRKRGPTIFTYVVQDPSRYGVLQLDEDGQPVDIVEKPIKPTSRLAVTGLYFYESDVVDMARALIPSHRGEIEITDINRAYLQRGDLRVEIFGRGIAWLDAGTHEALLDSSNYVAAVERRQGLKIACLEEVAWRLRWIDDNGLIRLANRLAQTAYGQYLKDLLETRLPLYATTNKEKR